MGLLRFFEEIRSDFLNSIVLALTNLGDETFFMITALVMLWCVNKKWGFRILAVFFTGITLNEGLKLIFKIPRPFVRDRSLSPVSEALARADGYSFPSGHVSTAVLTYGTSAAFIRKKWAFFTAGALVLITMFTRMYLGVHTPADVLAALLISSAVVAAFMPIFSAIDRGRINETAIYAAVTVISVAAVLITSLAGGESSEMLSVNNHACKMLGAALAVLLSFILDRKYIRFETRAPLLMQAIKLILGLIIVVALKSVLKILFAALGFDSAFAGCVRYFLMMMFAGTVWPLTFRFYTRGRAESH